MMSIEKIREFYAGNDHAAKDLLDQVKKRGEHDYSYTNEEFKKVANEIVNLPEHPLAKIIKSASKGNVTTAANMIQDLDMTGDVPILQTDVEKTWDNYVEMAKEMLK